MLFTVSPPAVDELVQSYGNGSLLGTSDEGTVTDRVLSPDWKQEEHQFILERLSGYGIRQGRLLDVGCLWGFFLTAACEEGFDVAGVEPYKTAVRYLRDVLGLTAYEGDLQSARLPASSFDVVSFLDVIEHLRDPVAELREAFRILQSGGMLIVVTPNVEGLPQRAVAVKRRVFRQPWCPIDGVPWHLWGFAPSTITRCVEKAGFQVESVHSIQPSYRTTNRGAGSTAWKRFALHMVAGVSGLLEMSDRMIVFASKREPA